MAGMEDCRFIRLKIHLEKMMENDVFTEDGKNESIDGSDKQSG